MVTCTCTESAIDIQCPVGTRVGTHKTGATIDTDEEQEVPEWARDIIEVNEISLDLRMVVGESPTLILFLDNRAFDLTKVSGTDTQGETFHRMLTLAQSSIGQMFGAEPCASNGCAAIATSCGEGYCYQHCIDVCGDHDGAS